MNPFRPINFWDNTVCHSTCNTAICLEDSLVCCDRVPRDCHTRHRSRSLVYSYCSARPSAPQQHSSLPTFPPLDTTSSWLQPQSPQRPNCPTKQMVISRCIRLLPLRSYCRPMPTSYLSPAHALRTRHLGHGHGGERLGTVRTHGSIYRYRRILADRHVFYSPHTPCHQLCGSCTQPMLWMHTHTFIHAYTPRGASTVSPPRDQLDTVPGPTHPTCIG